MTWYGKNETALNYQERMKHMTDMCTYVMRVEIHCVSDYSSHDYNVHAYIW